MPGNEEVQRENITLMVIIEKTMTKDTVNQEVSDMEIRISMIIRIGKVRAERLIIVAGKADIAITKVTMIVIALLQQHVMGIVTTLKLWFCANLETKNSSQHGMEKCS